MAYKPKKVQTGVDPKPNKDVQKNVNEPVHTCDVCGAQAVIRHNDGHFYCQPHYDLRLSSVSHEKIKTEMTGRLKTRPSNFSGMK